MEQPAVSAIILAGGASSRMGFNKALARLGPREGSQTSTLIERTIDRARSLASDIVIVANDEAPYKDFGERVVPDVYPRIGSLGGIYSGLLAAKEEHGLVVGCDMPFLSLSLWRYFLSLPRDYDVLVPRLGRHLEPLHAIYGKRCAGPIKKLIEGGQMRIIALLDIVRVRYVEQVEVDRFDPDHRSFFNVNTPADLAVAESMLEG